MTQRLSYWKTTGFAFAGASICLVFLATTSRAQSTRAALGLGAAALLVLLLVSLLAVAIGGLVCLWRDARITAGLPDPVERSANRIPAGGWLSRLGLRFLLGPALRPGDIVRVKSLSEIRQTLGADGALDGLPFMREMELFCGLDFRVHRRIDKINDMRHKSGLRRMHRVVTLAGVRCAGTDHGGCQAECQILWKDEWLTRLPPKSPPAQAPRGHATTLAPRFADIASADQIYVCQMTRLWEASAPMSRWDFRQDLRPLLWGNIGFAGYALAMLTRVFNVAQKLRGGIDFPAMPPTADATAGAPIAFEQRQRVRVRSREEIAATLKNSKTRGLWFDRDMVRFCGQRALVLKQVDRVIHESNATMVVMKTPSIVLDGVVATGEFLRLCPQHEFIFWRDAWLRPEDVDPQHGASLSSNR